MELARDEPRVSRQLDDLHEPALLERPAHDEARVDDPVAERVVHLVAVPVPFVDRRLALQLARARTLGELDRLRAEAHRAAEILDPFLFRKKIDDGERRLRIHLRRVRPFEPDDVPRELRDRNVHPEADPEVRDLALARDAAGEDLPLPAARAEPTRDEHTVDA